MPQGIGGKRSVAHGADHRREAQRRQCSRAIGGQFAQGYHFVGYYAHPFKALRPSSHGVLEAERGGRARGVAAAARPPFFGIQPEVTTVSMTRSRSKNTEKPL